MENQSTVGTCFLCGSGSSYKKIDYRSRRAYTCSNPNCGHYQISHAAMERLKGANIEFKKNAMRMANKCVGTNQVPEISVSGDQSVVINLVDR